MDGEQRLRDCQLTTPADLESETADATFDRSVVFETSGTTGEPKRVPYTSRDLVEQAQLGEDAFKVLGLTSDDAILNLGAPEPHISGLLLEIAAMETGVSTYNRSLADYEQVLENGHNEAITTVIGQPLFLRSLAAELTTDERSASDLFPNVERVVSTGGNLLPRVRTQLERLWDPDRVQEAYASTEFGCIAVRPSMDELFVPMLDYHDIELLSDGADGPESLVAIDDLDEPTTGSLVVSTRNREAYSFDRYEIGDGARVVPTEDGPRFEVLGRTDDAVRFGAIVLYEGEVASALDAAYDQSVQDWRAVVDANDVGDPGVTVYVTGDGIRDRTAEFREGLVEQSSAISTVDEFGIIDHIDVAVVDSLADCEWADDDFDVRARSASKMVFYEE
jgi:acyl-coenzyme A synthetase/AMP-(fatty) acid ligase